MVGKGNKQGDVTKCNALEKGGGRMAYDFSYDG